MTDPYLLVAVQILDGITAAALGVMVPLMIADITRGTGRFNLAQGIVGTAVGIGASISPTLAGYLTDHFGSSVAFFGLAVIAAVAFTAVWALMPETRARGAASRSQMKKSPAREARATLVRQLAAQDRRRDLRDVLVSHDPQPRYRRSPSGCDRRRDSRAPCGAR